MELVCLAAFSFIAAIDGFKLELAAFWFIAALHCTWDKSPLLPGCAVASRVRGRQGWGIQHVVRGQVHCTTTMLSGKQIGYM